MRGSIDCQIAQNLFSTSFTEVWLTGFAAGWGATDCHRVTAELLLGEGAERGYMSCVLRANSTGLHQLILPSVLRVAWDIEEFTGTPLKPYSGNKLPKVMWGPCVLGVTAI